jgi:hypothetical protein
LVNLKINKALKNIKKEWYVCHMIKVNNELYDKLPKIETEIPKTIFDGTYNKTFLFLLPLSGFEKHKFENQFVHCFYDSETKLHSNIEQPIYILCKQNKQLHEYMKSLPNYVYNYYVGKKDNHRHYMYCLSIDNPDYFTIVNSYYSQISKESKQKIINYRYFLDEKKSDTYTTTMDGILNRRKWLKTKLEKKLDINLDRKEYKSKFDSNLKKEIYLYGKEKRN